MMHWNDFRFVLSISIIFLSCRGSQAVSVCKYPLKCEETNCKQKEIDCFSGHCSDKGQCVCDLCWTGHSCDHYVNKHPPKFWTDRSNIQLASGVEAGSIIHQVSAYDQDSLDTCSVGWKDKDLDCTCAEIAYSIDGGNLDGVFTIDTVTGDIGISSEIAGLRDGTYTLLIGAENPTVDGQNQTYVTNEKNLASSRLTLTITVGNEKRDGSLYHGLNNNWNGLGYSLKDEKDEYDSYDEVHSRRKREVNVNDPIPANISFYLERNPNVSQIYDGSKITFRVTIHFPLGSTDVVVELFSSDNETTQAVLCNPRITHVGSNLAMGNVTPVLESVYGNGWNDRAVLDLGTVANSGSNVATPNASMVFIEYNVYKIYSNLTVSGSEYWLSAGASYNNENDIWVAQASYTTETDVFATNVTADITLSGPPQVEIGSAAKFTVDMYFPYPIADVAIDTFTPFNNSEVMSMCSVALKSTGLNYACLNNDVITSAIYPDPSGTGNNRGRLALGHMVNSGARDGLSYNHNDSRVSVEFVLYVKDDQAFVNQEYWVGAAVEIGEDEIWAGQMSVTAVNYTQKQLNMSQSLALSLTATDQTVIVGESVVVELNMVVPSDTEAGYKMTVITPFNDTARAKVCNISVVSTGRNIPCVNPGNIDLISLDNSSVSTKAIWSLGSIANFGLYDSSSNSSEDEVKIRIVVQVLNHELNYNVTDLPVTVGMEIGSNKIWVAERLFTAGNDTSEATNLTAADYEISYRFGDQHVHVGAVKDVQVAITLRPGVVYYPGTFEIILPFNNTSIMTLCRAEVIHVGSNLPCFNASVINATSVYSSFTNDTNYHKAAIHLGYICNIGNSTEALSDEDRIILRFAVRQEDYQDHANGTENWIGAGMMYQATELWVGQIQSVLLRDIPLEVTPTCDSQALFISPAANSNSTTYPGGAITFDILFKVPPQSTVDYTIDVAVNNDTLTVCTLRYIESGWNVPCPYTSSAANVTYGSSGRTTASMYIGRLTNIGADPVSNASVFDADTVRVQVVLQLSDDENAVPGGSEHWFSASLTCGGAQPAKADAAVIAGQRELNLSSIEPGIIYTTVNENGMELDTDGSPFVTKGQAIRFSLTLSIPMDAVWPLKVKFLTPLNSTSLMEICDVSVISVGANYPCLVKERLLSTYQSRTGSTQSDIGTIDLGTVCHIPVETTLNTSDTIVFEAVASVLRSVTLETGDTFWFGSTVTADNDVIYVSQLSLKYTETLAETYSTAAASVMNCSACSDNSSYVSINSTGVRQVAIGERFNVSVVITVPQNKTIPLTIDVRVPTNVTALMIITGAKLTRAGANLCGLTSQTELVIPTLNNSLGNSQTTTVLLDMHAVTNTGLTSRVDNYTYQPEDDQFTFDISLQLADSPASEHLSQHAINVGVDMGAMVYVAKETIEIVRTNNEEPDLEINITMDASRTYGKSDSITINGNVKHTDQSTAEAQNVTVSFYLPPSLNLSTFSALDLPMASRLTAEGLFTITIPQILFADTEKGLGWFAFDLIVRPDYGRSEIEHTVLPYDVCSYMYYRQGNVNPEGTEFCSSLEAVEFNIDPQGWPACYTQMTSIQTCQLKGSPSETAVSAGMNSGSGWKGFYRGEVYDPYRYLQVEIGNNTRLTVLQLFHIIGVDVTQIMVMTSNDGIAWVEDQTVSIPVRNQQVNLYPPIEAPFLRFYFREDTPGPTIIKNTLALFGCNIGSHSGDLCQAAESTTAAHIYRSFLVATNTTYVCDFLPTQLLDRVCYSTTDGAIWTDLDSRVANVICFDVTEGDVYAVGKTDDTYLMAKEGSDTWCSISPAMWAAVQATCQPAKQVQWTSNLANPVSSLIQGDWGANFNGLYHSESGIWVQHLDWTN